MVRAAQRDDALAVLAGPLDGLLHDRFADVLAEAVVAVEGQHGAAVVEQLGAAVGLDEAFGQHAAVIGQDGQAVAGVADPVRLDQVLGDVAGDVVRHPLGGQQALAERDGLGNREFHGALLTSSPASAST
ncbi:Uncharacterised protein [Bordetella pertussis]|nr:Uncharacterised protein [Bordetella pertussis]CFP56470.1 Uncharacterised protein [Bordetella pertussis]CFT95584.1 Uncharacterised protein [Bordetella pertussis]CFV98537.1 Uncharacterised protein [Bordetella pertussis]